MSPKSDSGSDLEVLPSQKDSTESLAKSAVEPPHRFRVLLHDDDFTSMDFVEGILESVFGHDPEAATRIMLDVHEKGIGLAGIFPHEVAEAKAAKVMELAQAEGFPFLATIEPDEE